VRKGISVGVFVAIAVAAMVLSGATSAAGPGGARSATPSTVSGQVRATGAAVVKQIGARNYAGPNCPGVSWNCTTSTRVIQVATRAGINVANTSCVLQSCLIQQSGPSNVAKCTQNSTGAGANQSCTIEQTGASNMATVSQTISQSTGAIQSGTQTASVTQGTDVARSTAFNVLKVTQSVSQSTKTVGGAQEQNAHQKVFVSQWAGGAGYNQSAINQSQLQKAYGGAPQSQNAAQDSGADCLSGAPSAPNACSDVNQHSASGTNYSALNQSIDQDANTAVLGAFQQQGSSAGGLEGHVHQDTVSGSSQNKAKQDKHQKANGPADGSQLQFDPVRCCGTASQFGGSGNVEDINQSSSIGASNPGANQHSMLIGESVTPNGKCNVNQHAAIDSASANNSETLTPCPYLTLTTSCSTGSIDIDAVFRGDNCTAFEPYFGVDSTLDKTVRNGDGSFADTADASTGDTVEFKIDYTNTGPADADNVTVTDVVPDGLAYVEGSCSSAPNPCTYDSGTKTIAWNLGTVPGDETPSLTFEAEVVQEVVGSITNTANAATLEEGAGAASDSATVTVVDQPPVSALAVQVRNVTAGETAYNSVTGADVGDVIVYRVVYSNNGAGAAHNVLLSLGNTPPTGTSYTNALLFDNVTASLYCPLTVTLGGTCQLGQQSDPGTVPPGMDPQFTTMYFAVTVDVQCNDISYTATGSTAEEGAITSSTPATVDLFDCPA
jgi:uncharacterized repeat protein (TIGR01451 family)